MDENKTGVWMQTKGRHRKRLDSDDEIRLSIGDYIQVFSDVNADEIKIGTLAPPPLSAKTNYCNVRSRKELVERMLWRIRN